MEPERQIEKLLRACAKKRRDAGSNAFKLQPWVRRRLQDEVAKQFADTGEESLSLWQLFRQQWAVLAGFALFIFLGASLFLPALSSAKHKAKRVQAVSQLRQIGAAAQMAAVENNGRLPATLDSLTNGYIGGGTLTDPTSGKPFVYVAGGEQLEGLQTNAVLAYSMETGERRAVLFADGSVQMMSEQTFAALNPRPAGNESSPMEVAANAPAPAAIPPAMTIASGLTETNPIFGHIAMARLAIAAPAAQKSGQFFENRAAAGAASATFALRAVNGVRNLNQMKAKAETNISVLASFELRRNGNDIVIVDQDGSIYSGSIITAAAGIRAGGGASEQQAGQNIPFQASGQNLSLNKNVSFIGEVLSISNNVETNTATKLALPANSRIIGTATVDSTNVIQIDAVPAAP